MSDHRGAGLMVEVLPHATELIAHRGYDSDSFRAAVKDLGITRCFPSRTTRKHPHSHDPALYRQRHPIENLFAKLKEWRPIATRCDRCAGVFMGAVTPAATVISSLRK